MTGGMFWGVSYSGVWCYVDAGSCDLLRVVDLSWEHFPLGAAELR